MRNRVRPDRSMKRGAYIALNVAVLVSTVLSPLVPALDSPAQVVGIQTVAHDWRYDLEEIAFRLLGAGEARAFISPQAGFEVVDRSALLQRVVNEGNEDKRQTLREFIEKNYRVLENAAFVAGIQSLDYFMQTMAYDVATWLASGGEGQQPMFYTDGWGEYLKNLADQSAGGFIEKLSGSWLGFGVCEPSASLKISIGLGLADISRPRRPQCTAREMLDNWESAVNDPDFLDNISINFEPEQNDIGIAFSIFSQYYQTTASELYTGTKERENSGGWKAVTAKISKIVKTPESLVKARAESLTTDAAKSEWQKVQYGDIVQAAIGTFVNTLAGKLFERIFKEGLIGGSDEQNSSDLQNTLFGFLQGLRLPNRNNDGVTSPAGSVQGLLGSEAARVRFLDLLQTGNKIQERPYDVLTKLAFCADPENPGPDECVVRPDFRTAIVNKLTLQEAIDQGLINGDMPFGIEYDGTALFRGLPYRSIVILRTFSIVPVGWEIAAEAINKFDKTKRPSLRDLINVFDDPSSRYHALVDPNWVLTLPEHLCKAEGYGGKLIFNQTSGGSDTNRDGDFNDTDDIQPQRLVGRATYCADYQSCIEKNDDGTCKYYGYCQGSRRTWDPQGTSCPAYYNTCQTFENQSGQQVSYLQNSIDFNGCSIDNAGCQWYCRAYNPVNKQWTCDAPTERVLKPCTQAGGCSLTARCSVPYGDVMCSDAASQVNLSISPACGPGSKWWSDNGTPSEPADDSCRVSTSCTIPQGGVSCATNGCEALTNFLLNPSFETRAEQPGVIARSWETSNNSLAYFQRVSGASERVHNGSNSIRFYNAGTAVDEQLISQPILLAPDKAYTFSVWVYNRLQAGFVDVRVAGGDPQPVSKRSTVKNGWEQLSFDFTGSSTTVVTVRIHNDGGQVAGTAWIDDVRISESCVTNPVTLSLVGTIEQNESKIHLDRDAQTCNANDAGCSQFIRVKPNLGTNLVRNASFEDWPDPEAMPPGWAVGEEPTFNVMRSTSTPNLGGFSAKLSNNGNQDVLCKKFKTLPVTMKANTTYRVSFWARSNQDVSPTPGVWFTEILSDFNPLSYCSLKITQSCNPLADTDECAADDMGVCLPDWQHLTTSNANMLRLSTAWQRFVMDPITTRIAGNNFTVSFSSCSYDSDVPIYVDGVQVEEVATANPIVSQYSDYGAANIIHLRKPPQRLNCTGNSSIDPDECGAYAPICRQEEVGCEAYRPVRGGSTIPAVIKATDACPAECVGYEAYRQSTTFFESQESLDYFIPRTARQCSAAQVGCTEFTNLDEVAAGGEGREFYQFLRLCEQSGSASCQNFYTWQGSEETGYQLRVYSLSAQGSEETGYQPLQAITNPADWPDRWCGDKGDSNGDSSPDCCDSADDVLANPFCKQLYGVDGSITYRIYDNTISCSDNCHPYRKTRLGESDTDAQENCEGSTGTWNNGQCIYQAIPNQGIACAEQFAGCREYRGNTGGNVFITFNDTFEDGEATGWQYGTISLEALSVGGHSLRSGEEDTSKRVATYSAGLSAACTDTLRACTDTIRDNCFDQSLARCVARDTVSGQTCLVAPGEQHCGQAQTLFNEGKTYLLSFWAKANSANPIDGVTIELRNAIDADPLSIGGTIIDGEWRYYTFGPFSYSGAGTGDSTRLIIAAPAGNTTEFFVDNVQVKEVTSHAYVIRNSWNTPVSCDMNPNVNPPAIAPQYMLGCEQYRDSTGKLYNLKSFDTLCREEAVGCEALIDTYNSNSPSEKRFNVNDATSDIMVPADSAAYLVNRPEFRCNGAAEGCEAMGLPLLNSDDKITGYQTVYRINDPDQYDTALCTSEEVMCQEFKTSDGFAYFKDPRGKTCLYRQIPAETGFGWFKIGSISATPDCPVVQPPVGSSHPDPARGWAGQCAADFSGCTQYIDPTNDVGTNMLFNGSLDIDVNEDNLPDGWDDDPSDAATDELLQSVTLKADTLYTLSFSADINNVRGPAGDTFIIAVRNCPGIVSYDHSLVYPDVNDTTVMRISPSAYRQDTRTAQSIAGLPDVRQYSGRFMVPDSQSCKVRLRLLGGNPTAIDNKILEVGLRETGSFHALKNSVDTATCNGLVDPEVGCVLFNDRSQVNYKIGEDDITSLVFDADVSSASVNGGLAVVSCAGTCDSNAILKVRPDRTCESWLNCRTLGTFIDSQGVERTYCAALGSCDALDENGNCTSELSARTNRSISVYSDRDQISNMTGYSRPGLRFNTGVCDNRSPQSSVGQICSTNADCAGGFCDRTVNGYLPYADMKEVGQSARIANGGFEFSVAGSTEPVGWSTVSAQESLDANDPRERAPIEWFDYKFKVERDFNNLIEGTSYLRLNTFYEAVSEQIDVEPGSEYILTVQSNTQFLEHPNRTVQPEAQLLVKAFKPSDVNDGNNNVSVAITDVDNGTCQTVFGGWQVCSGMSVVSGLGWQRRSLKFTVPPAATRIQLKLSNYVNEFGCVDNERYVVEGNGACELGGYSLFDDISLKSVLGVDEQPRYVSRSCRLYPTVDALSCNYVKDSSIFFGKYGYCVAVDPRNPSQCLQWWPLDQINGETLDEVTSGYSDRVPLDYCTEKKDQNIRVSEGGFLSSIGNDIPSEFANIISGNGTEMTFSSFRVSEDYRALFRYPYVQSIRFRGFLAGGSIAGGAAFIPIPFSAWMYKDHVCWKFVDFGFGDNTSSGPFADFLSRFSGADANSIIGNWYIGTSTTPQLRQQFWRAGTNPNYDNDYGSICWSIGPEAEWGGFGAIGIGVSFDGIGVAFAIPIPYSLVNSPLASVLPGLNEQITDLLETTAGFAGPVSVRIITDQDSWNSDAVPDPISGIGGDILGGAWEIHGSGSYVSAFLFNGKFIADVPVRYCSEVARVVTAAGSNKGYANRLSSGSGYLLNDTIDDTPLQYRYFDPFDFRRLLADPENYHSSDYQPFGAVVAPDASQYPTAWDSKQSQYRQPLLYEPPRSDFDPPYQARMGEPHTAESIKQIFAKSYGIWHWQWNDERLNQPIDEKNGGQYIEGSSPTASNLPWDIPTSVCEGVRLTDSYCFVRPFIDANNMLVNGKRSTTITTGIGTVKLTFTVKVDPDQLPLTAYSVDWGDDNFTTVSGVTLRNRSNPDNPFVLYHLYDYWAMQKEYASSRPANLTCTSDQCTATIRVKATDNWNADSGYIEMDGEVKVNKPK